MRCTSLYLRVIVDIKTQKTSSHMQSIWCCQQYKNDTARGVLRTKLLSLLKGFISGHVLKCQVNMLHMAGDSMLVSDSLQGTEQCTSLLSPHVMTSSRHAAVEVTSMQPTFVAVKYGPFEASCESSVLFYELQPPEWSRSRYSKISSAANVNKSRFKKIISFKIVWLFCLVASLVKMLNINMGALRHE